MFSYIRVLQNVQNIQKILKNLCNLYIEFMPFLWYNIGTTKGAPHRTKGYKKMYFKKLKDCIKYREKHGGVIWYDSIKKMYYIG